MDRVKEHGTCTSDAPTLPGQEGTPVDLDLAELSRLENDLERRVKQIARWNPAEELDLENPRVGGVNSHIWRRLVVGWLHDPLLANRYSEATVRGLQMALNDFDADEIAVFIRSLLRPGAWS
jgi:hypothetical protein